MTSRPERARIDLSESAYGEGLERALAGSALLASAGLGNLDAQQLLQCAPGEAPEVVQDSPRLRFARRLFGLVPEAGWEEALLPPEVRAITLSRQTILFREAENLLARRCEDDPTQALLISVSNTLPASAAQALSRRLAAAGASTDLDDLLRGAGDVLAGARFQLADGTLGATYRRADDASRVEIDTALTGTLASALGGTLRPGEDSLVAVAARSMERATSIEFESDGQLHSISLVPMVPGSVLELQASGGIDMDLLRRIQRDALNDALRVAIGALLDGGLDTQVAPFPNTETEFLAIVDRLRHLDEDDLIARLDIGGFAPHGFGEGEDFQQCKECIYYLPHRKWCDIPELPLPVEPHWWCRLWKL